MTIHSMPNNKKFDDNYDRIFGKSKPEPEESPDSEKPEPETQEDPDG